MSKNDITGDDITTGVSSQEYRDQFETIYKRTYMVSYVADGKLKSMAIEASSTPAARRAFWNFVPSNSMILEIK